MSNHALGMSYIYAPCIESAYERRAADIPMTVRRMLQGRGIREVKLNRACAVQPSWEGQVSTDLRTLIWGINETNAFAGETRKLIAALVRAAIAAARFLRRALKSEYVTRLCSRNLCRLIDTRDFTRSLVERQKTEGGKIIIAASCRCMTMRNVHAAYASITIGWQCGYVHYIIFKRINKVQSRGYLFIVCNIMIQLIFK